MAYETAPPLPPGAVDFNALHDLLTRKKPPTEAEVAELLAPAKPEPEAAPAPVSVSVSEPEAAPAPAAKED